MKRPMNLLLGVVCGLMALALSGCGSSDLGTVTGKVTLDGQPVADALLVFSPVNGGSPSAGKTDEQGRFSLVYTLEKHGAEPGEHQVWISTAIPGDEDGEVPRPAATERIPAPYREAGGLKAEVKLGRNKVNFELVSGGTSLTSLR